MTRHRLLHLLAAICLALGQCALVIHAVDHELEAKAKACELCTIAHAAAGPPALVVLPAGPVFLPQFAAGAVRPAVAGFRYARPWRTGPPLLPWLIA